MGNATTAPKGRATRARNADDRAGRFMGPTMQWILVVIAGIAIIGAIFYFGSDFRSTGGGHSGSPADAPATIVLDDSAA